MLALNGEGTAIAELLCDTHIPCLWSWLSEKRPGFCQKGFVAQVLNHDPFLLEAAAGDVSSRSDRFLLPVSIAASSESGAGGTSSFTACFYWYKQQPQTTEGIGRESNSEGKKKKQAEFG